MARNSPGGSGVTRGFPASLTDGPAVDTSKWTVEYEVDFSGEGAHDFEADTTQPIKLVTWTAIEETKADPFDLDGSTGLRIFAETNSGPWFGGSTNAPTVSAKITDMMSSLSQDDTICMQLHMDSASDVSANYHSYGLGLWDGTEDDATGFVLSRRVFDSAQKTGFIANTTQDLTSTGTQSDFFEIVWVPADGMVLSAGVIGSGEWPDPLATTTQRSYNSMHGQGPGASLTWRIPYADARVAIFAYAQGGATAALNATAYKVRVLRRKKT